MLRLVEKSVPCIIIVGREHVPWLDNAREIVMAVEVPFVAALYEPGAAAGAARHTARYGDHRATPVLPAFAGRTLAGYPGLAVIGIRGRVAIGVELLIGRLIISPAGAADQLGQVPLAIGSYNGHAKVMMQVICPGPYPVGRNLQIARGPAAKRRTAFIVQWTEDQILHPAAIPVEAVAGGVNNTLVEAYNGSTGAGHVLTGGVGSKDFSNGRERIRRFPIAWGLPHLLGCFPQALVDAPLRKIGSIADLLIRVGGSAHGAH